MSVTILIKRNPAPGIVPVPSQLTPGELALNTGDGNLYYLDISGSDSGTVKQINALSASFATTAAFAMNGGGGGGGSGTPVAAYSNGTLVTASVTQLNFRSNLSASLSSSVVNIDAIFTVTQSLFALGTVTRGTINFVTPSIASGTYGTGSVQLGKSFILYRVSGSQPSRLRLYSSQSFRDLDVTRSIGSDPVAGSESGLLLELISSGAVNFIPFELSPLPIGADLSPTPTGFIHYTVDNLVGSTVSYSIDITRVELETANTASLSSSLYIPFFTAPSTQLTALPSATFEPDDLHRTKIDLSRFTQVRVVGRVSSSGSAQSFAGIQYSTDEITWSSFQDGNAPSISLALTGTIAGPYVVVPGGAQTDVFLRWISGGGNATASPILGNFNAQFR